MKKLILTLIVCAGGAAAWMLAPSADALMNCESGTRSIVQHGGWSDCEGAGTECVRCEEVITVPG